MASWISRLLAGLRGPKKRDRGARRSHRRRLHVEAMEMRRLLAGDLGAIEGTVFTDTTDDGFGVGTDTPIQGATVNLFLDDGDGTFDGGTADVLAGQGTGTGGGTGISVTDASGNYRFNNLGPGTYFVRQQAVTGQLQRTSETIKTVVVSNADAAGTNRVTVDSFDTVTSPDPLTAAPGATASDQVATATSETLGGERDVFVSNDGGSASNLQFDINPALGVVVIDAGNSTTGTVAVSYDGVDAGGANTINHTTLNGGTFPDLTLSGAEAFHFLVGSQSGSSMRIDVFSNATDFSSTTVSLPTTTGGSPTEDLTVRFADFAQGSGATNPADFTSVSAILIEITMASADDVAFDLFRTVAPTVLTENFANLNPMSIGNQVFQDADNNGVFDSGESGISGVTVQLFNDDGTTSGVIDAGDTQAGTTTTDGSGTFTFGDLLPGDYIVLVPDSQFATSSDPLFGFLSSSGNDPAPDPDVSVTDNDDNGTLVAGFGVATAAVTLQAGAEPTNDGDSDPNSDLTVDLGFTPQIDLTVTKSAGSVTTVTAGNQLTYTLSISNQGDAAANNVVVVDDLPNLSPDAITIDSVVSSSGSGVVTQTGNSSGEIEIAYTSLASGATDTITVVVTIPATAAAAAAITNASTITGDGQDTNTANNSSSVDVAVDRQATLQITKSDTPDPVAVGATLTYEIVVTNTGPSTATNVVISDTLPSGLTFSNVSLTFSDPPNTTGTAGESGGVVTGNIPTLGVNDSVTMTVTSTVQSSFSGSTIPNTATADADEATQVTAQADTTVNPQVDLEITKSDNADPVNRGDRLTYTLNVVNNGPSEATNVEIVDTLPAGVTFVSATGGGTVTGPNSNNEITIPIGTLAASGTAQITVEVDVSQSAADSITNTAVVSSTESTNGFDTNTANNTVSEGTTVQSTIDLEVTKTDSADPVVPGESFSYTIVVTNNGPSDATQVNLTDNIPDGIQVTSVTSTVGTATVPSSAQDSTASNPDDVTVDIGNLANGATATITVQATVLADTRGTLNNVATVSTADTSLLETVTNNNSVTEPTTLTPEVDLRLTKSDSLDPVLAGNALTYTIIVTNDGPSTATNVNVTDALPSGVTFSQVTASQGSASESNGTVTAQLGTLPPSASATITVDVTVDASTRGQIDNTASVTSTENDTNTADNSATASTDVNASVDLVVTKTDSLTTVAAGGTLTYTITVRNDGPSDATNVVVTDSLPSGLTFTSASSSAGTVNNSGNDVTANIGTLAPNATATITINASVSSSATGQLSNTASADASETDSNSADNSATDTTDIAVPGSIAGVVYIDANQNGVQDSGEDGIAGVTITLTGTDILNASVNRTVTTDANGAYLFDNLLPGTYTLTQTQPEGFGDGQSTVGQGATGTAGTNQITSIELTSGATATAFNFGEQLSPLSKRRLLASSGPGD